ncbi:MAG: pilus assembly protein TadG-related protein [Paracoccaceae bacterium]|nr:pilus assembly protein TadG-related protein [Paracoccaceae bacterium]
MTLLAAILHKTADAVEYNNATLRCAFKRFRREEDGSLLIFGLFCFVMMLLLAGVALDLMRFEERRTMLQNTIDRAALAAADLDQTLAPKDVVKDYFLKAGLTPPKDADIKVFQPSTGDYRKVEISVAEVMPTWFMNMAGIDIPYLNTTAASTAEESVGQLEISLILDVSGSMNSNNRLVNLKPAAKAFVDKIFESGEAGKVSISIIPYSTQVSAGPDLLSHFNVTNEQTVSNCIEFTPADYTKTSMDMGFGVGTRVYQRNGDFDPFYKAKPPYLTNCPTEASRRIMPFSDSPSALKTYIDNLSASGNTSIDIGMKWGTALLDPSLQSVVDDMIADGDLPNTFSERPYVYTDKEALKIIVLMTDGANTTEYRLRDQYDHGVSLLYTNTAYSLTNKNGYSLYNPSTGKYFSFYKDQWRDQPWGDGSGETGEAVQMTWPEVWSAMSMYYFSDEIIYDAYGSSSLRNSWRPGQYTNPVANTYINTGTNPDKDDLTIAMCNAAKASDKDIRIYSIAFEAPTSGQNLLKNCASADANYYAALGASGIDAAFAGIVNSINKLRLTH